LVQVLKNVQGVVTKPYDVYRPDLYSVYSKDQYKNYAVLFRMIDEMSTLAYIEAADSNYSKGTENYKSLDKYGSNNPANEPAKPDNPFTSVLFRKAWALSMDYEEVLDVIFTGMGIRMEGIVPKEMLGHDDQLIEKRILPEFSPIEAKSLFKQVGWSSDIDFSYKSSDTLRKAVSQLLKNTIESYDVSISIIIYMITYYLHENESWITTKNNYTNPLIDSMIDTFENEIINKINSLYGFFSTGHREMKKNEWNTILSGLEDLYSLGFDFLISQEMTETLEKIVMNNHLSFEKIKVVFSRSVLKLENPKIILNNRFNQLSYQSLKSFALEHKEDTIDLKDCNSVSKQRA
jgi:hypothetical protein